MFSPTDSHQRTDRHSPHWEEQWGPGLSPGTVPAALVEALWLSASSGTSRPLPSACLWGRPHCIHSSNEWRPRLPCPAASGAVPLARSAFFPGCLRCLASLVAQEGVGALALTARPRSPAVPFLMCLLPWGWVTDSRAFRGPGCRNRAGVPQCQETRVVGTTVAMCPVLSDLSIFQKKLEIQILCVCNL